MARQFPDRIEGIPDETSIKPPISEEVRTTIKSDKTLDLLIKVTAKSLRLTTQFSLELIFDLNRIKSETERMTWNGEVWENDSNKANEIENKWLDAIQWGDSRTEAIRKTRLLGKVCLENLDEIQNVYPCTRDIAFTAGCLVGLEEIFRLLLIDDSPLFYTETNERDYKCTFGYEDEIKCDLRLFSMDDEGLPDLDAIFQKRAMVHRKIRLARRKAIMHAFNIKGQLPSNFAKLFEEYSLQDLKDTDPITRSGS